MVWDHSAVSKNRDRLLEADIAGRFLNVLLEQPRVKRLLSADHFSVAGTLIEAWASMKSIKSKDADEPPSEGGGRNREGDLHGEKRSKETHASMTDPEARLYRKGTGMEAKGPTSVAFEWLGFDEGDEIAGEGDAELLDDGSIKIEFAYDNGDEAVLTARRWSFST